MVASQKSKEWLTKIAGGQSILLFLPIEGKPLNTKLHGTYTIEKRGQVNYLLEAQIDVRRQYCVI